MLDRILLCVLDIILQILLHEILGLLIVLLIVLTRVARIEVQVFSLRIVFRCLLKGLSVDHSLRLVVHVVSKESFLRVKFLLTELVDFSYCSDNAVLVFVSSVGTVLKDNKQGETNENVKYRLEQQTV